jgi:para-nitrobenzyl esterase
MLPSIASLFATALVSAMALPASADPVRIESGLVDGVSENGITVFKGIPFAASPVGDLRWREPAPVAAWNGIRRADAFSPICMQRGSYPEDAPPEPMSEDCLTLNIWVPDGATAGANLPVMVWIYGGGLLNGTASTPLYAGDELARRGVIVVTANYRLGAFGFLAHPELSSESEHKVSGNYGLLDQIAALKWVRRNIGAFGGDSENVTVFGQSSGSISISVLCASPLARDLFRRVIGQSGGLFEPLEVSSDFTLAAAEKAGESFAGRFGASSIAALRAKSAAAIVAARFSPNAVIDGHLLSEPPYNALAAGRGCDADILVGSNAAEGLSFLTGRRVTAANLNALLGEDFPPFVVSLIGPKTPADDAAAKAAYVTFEGAMRFGWDMRTWAQLNAAGGGGKTFLYRFEHAPPGAEGAHHGAEMSYVFGHPLTQAWGDGDRALAETMGSYWTNFARTGDPNAPGLPLWPAFTAGQERALLINSGMRTGSLPDDVELDAIGRLYATIRFVIANMYAIGGVVIVFVLALLYFLWRLMRPLVRRRSRAGIATTRRRP